MPKCGWGEKRSPGLPAPMSVGAVFDTRGLAAQWWGLVGRGRESCPVPDAGLPRRAGSQSAIHVGRTVSVLGGMRVCVCTGLRAVGTESAEPGQVWWDLFSWFQPSTCRVVLAFTRGRLAEHKSGP